jgi:cytochrome c-type biogenesis protein
MNGPGGPVLALLAGLVSFLSPCTLPLLPGYLSYISGIGSEEVRAGERPAIVVGAALLFVLGFSLIFAALGASASYLGSLLLTHRDIVNRVAGIFIIVMALFMLGVFRFPVLYMERRFHVGRELGIWSALPLGMAFAAGWSPCTGPVLASIYTYAAATTGGKAEMGALLLFIYGLGLGVPFVLMALFAGRAFTSLNWLKRHFRIINRAGGAILLVMGIFLLMNRWTQLLSPVMQWYANNVNLPL